ncbi:MAG: hypothetical protein AAF804_17250, partial [Bacteroidota bacterium]
MWIKIWVWIGLACLFGPVEMMAQQQLASYYGGQYRVYVLTHQGMAFKCFDFDLDGGRIELAYLGQAAGTRLAEWQKRKGEPLCYLAAGFARDYESGQPLGASIEQGKVINRQFDPKMDGLMCISSSGRRARSEVEVMTTAHGYKQIQSELIRKMVKARGSLLQTQLLYAQGTEFKPGPRKYGKKASRRFLAICKDQQGNTHHVIMDLVKASHLNDAAQKSLAAL